LVQPDLNVCKKKTETEWKTAECAAGMNQVDEMLGTRWHGNRCQATTHTALAETARQKLTNDGLTACCVTQSAVNPLMHKVAKMVTWNKNSPERGLSSSPHLDPDLG